MIVTGDALAEMKKLDDTSADIVFCDPPYALGSEVIIKSDGKPDYSKAVDFMNKWKMPDGTFWESWFKEAARVLKHGGWCIMYGMDRQLLMPKYYGAVAGLKECQSIYWYFISNFPKSLDLSKMLDKNAGAEREIIGSEKSAGYLRNKGGGDGWAERIIEKTEKNIPETSPITAPAPALARKYSGYKYSIAPLKQCCETVLVFQKPTLTGSVLHDCLAYENGDKTVSVSALDIDGNRVPIKNVNREFGGLKNPFIGGSNSGRYPAAAFVSPEAAEILDKQSGEVTSGANMPNVHIQKGWQCKGQINTGFFAGDKGGGCSKILHKCRYEKAEHDIFMYEPKVSKSERNRGCQEMEAAEIFPQNNSVSRKKININKNIKTKNNHPCLKPIDLNRRILSLFKTPNPQRVIIPFAGSGSEILGALRADYTDIIGIEINPEYVKIAEARVAEEKKQEKLF